MEKMVSLTKTGELWGPWIFTENLATNLVTPFADEDHEMLSKAPEKASKQTLILDYFVKLLFSRIHFSNLAISFLLVH